MIAPLVLLVSLRACWPRPRTSDGARPRAATAPASSVRASPRSLDPARAARRAGRLRRPPGRPRAARRRDRRARRSSSSASIASPATTCAGPCARPGRATCRRRSTRDPRRHGSRDWRRTSTSLDPASSTSSTTRSRPPPPTSRPPPPNFEPVARTGDYMLWKRDGDTPGAGCSRTRAATRARFSTASAEGRRLSARQGHRGRPRPSRSSPTTPTGIGRRRRRRRAAGQERGWEAPGTRRAPTRPSRRRVDYRALAPVPLPGGADRALRRRPRSPSCPPRSTACT